MVMRAATNPRNPTESPEFRSFCSCHKEKKTIDKVET